MKYLLDANICILLLDGKTPRLNARVRDCDEGDLAISAIAFAEVAKGSKDGKPPPMEVLEGFAKEVPILAFEASAARAYATLAFRRASFDRLVAAHALALGVTLITSNEKHFADVPGLAIENWTQ